MCKQSMKIWTAYTKLLRNQANKDRLIDSTFMGVFFKAVQEEFKNNNNNCKLP